MRSDGDTERPSIDPLEAGGRKNGFAQRMEELEHSSTQTKKARAIMAMADGLSAAEIHDAIEKVAKLHRPWAEDVLVQLFSRWGEIDPRAALQYLHELPGEISSKFVDAVVETWAAGDAIAAEKHISTLPNGFVKEVAQSSFIAGHGGA